jgi:hypothetical protein
VTVFTTRTEKVGHKLYLDNLFPSHGLLYDLRTKTINCCGIDMPN